MQSETIGKLVEALAKAKEEFGAAVKDSLNPHYRSKYADLDTVVSATTPALSKHGLVVVQSFDGDNLVTLLAHSSGEWISGSQPLHAAKLDPQGIAGASTYARRYGHMAICGIAPEDDDGNTAQQAHKQSQQSLNDDYKQSQWLLINSVEKKTSPNNKNFVVVSFANGATASTFSTTLAEECMAIMADKRPCIPVVEEKEVNGKKFFNLKEIKA